MDLDIYNNHFFVAYKSILVIYNQDGIEESRIDLKKDLNINRLNEFEIDSFGNIWLFTDDGDIYVLDENYNQKKSFNYLGVDQVNECKTVNNNNEIFYFCNYYQGSALGLLVFEYNQNDLPEYLDYYSITEDAIFLNLNYFEDNLYFSTESKVYSENINSDLKSEWDSIQIDLDVLETVNFPGILFFVSNEFNSGFSIVDQHNNLINEFDVNTFNIDNFIGAATSNDHLIVVTNQQIAVFDSNYEEVNFSSLNSAQYEILKFKEDYVIASIKNQGFKIGTLDNLFSKHILSNSSPLIDGYNAIQLMSDGGLIAIGGGKDESNESYSSILHYNNRDFINYGSSSLYISLLNDNPQNPIILIDYVMGQKSPSSIIELDNQNILFSNSGLTLSQLDDDNTLNRGGIVRLNLLTQEIDNIYNSHNSTLGGMQGVYSENIIDNYTVIGEMIESNNNIWVVNPYDELFGNVISKYSIALDEWSGVNVSNTFDSNESNELYMPQGIAFDSNNQIWVSFRDEPSLSSNSAYSNGGIRYINSNNQFKKVENDEILIGGVNSNVWSIDICSYEGSDVLWVLSSDGVQGYTIFNNELNSVLGQDLFIDIPFYDGDRIKCDQHSNVWVTTKHSGVRVLLSDSNYTESWPSFSGITEDNSGLLSDVVYDIDFNEESGEIYFSTDLGIAIMESPFGQISYDRDDRYKIYFDKNPFLIPKDEEVIISNVPMGSKLKIITLDGKVLRTINEQSFTMYQWDGKDQSGNYVPSGVYIVVSSSLEEKTVVGKIAVVREK